MYDINKVRADFPILSREVYGKPLVYLDNAATTQKPRQVVDALVEEYYNVNANVHRGVHYLSQQATDLHEAARERVRQFINAAKIEEIVFTRGTTESLNLVAATFAEQFMKEGDEVIVSVMEHHSNIVPWQLQASKRGIRLRVIPMTDDGQLQIDEYERLFNERTRIVSVAHVSNVLGTVNPVNEIIRIAHEHDVPVMIDGAQSAPHFKVDVQAMDCDFFAFSGHKMYGPTGVGVLYGKERWLEQLPPYQGGGEMIDRVTFEHTTFERLPFKFEAGTPDYVATNGLARAIDYLETLGMENIAAHEQDLTRYAMQRLGEIEGMHIYGTPLSAMQEGATIHDAVISFNIQQPSSTPQHPSYIHHLDLGTLLDRLGIAVRTGHHCAQPLMDRLGILGTVRASFALYNTREEVDVLAKGIARVAQMF
ncbi:MAG: cysteine desulfurase [Prevotellaceae bacterium]|nr:cysteine desulfurase [Prevotellaceae bacterium]